MIQRFRVKTTVTTEESMLQMTRTVTAVSVVEEDSHGEWVRWADYEALVATLPETRIAKLEAKIKELQDEIARSVRRAR